MGASPCPHGPGEGEEVNVAAQRPMPVRVVIRGVAMRRQVGPKPCLAQGGGVVAIGPLPIGAVQVGGFTPQIVCPGLATLTDELADHVLLFAVTLRVGLDFRGRIEPPLLPGQTPGHGPVEHARQLGAQLPRAARGPPGPQS